MRILVCIILLFPISVVFGQRNGFSIDFVYRPEITNYRDSISFRWKEKTPRHTVSAFGFRVLPEYHFTSNFFVRAGVGFINRKFNNIVFFNQSLLGDSLAILLTSRRTEYRIVEFPIAIGYSLYSKNNIEVSVLGELDYNYLLNAYYNPRGHEGEYKKRYWLGKSFLGLLSANYKVNQNLKLSFETGYSFINESKKDIFLFSQDEPVISIEHNFIPIMIGLKYNFN